MTIKSKLKELLKKEYPGRVFIKVVKDNKCLAIVPLTWLSYSRKIEPYLDVKYTGFRIEVEDNGDDEMFPFIETVLVFEVE